MPMKKFRGGNVTGGSTEKIGKTGNLPSTQSGGGGQYPFMPGPSSYSGRKGGNTSSGVSDSSSKTDVPWLPKKPK